MGHYEIEAIFENRATKIKTIDDQHVSFIVNGHMLRLYHKPTSKEDFTHQIQQQSDIEWVNGGILPSVPLNNLQNFKYMYICK